MSNVKDKISFLKNKKVLITGNTGFKGSWLTYVVSNVTQKIYGISLKENIESRYTYVDTFIIVRV